MDGVLFRGYAEHLGTDPDDRADVAGFQMVGANDFFLRFHQRVHIVRDVHLEDFRRIQQAFRMFRQAEDGGSVLRLVCAHALEHRHAVM